MTEVNMIRHRVLITGDGTLPGTRVSIDGKPLNGVAGLTLTMSSPRGPAVLELRMLVECTVDLPPDIRVEPLGP